MNIALIVHLAGVVLVVEALFMFLPAVLSLGLGWGDADSLLYSCLITLVSGAAAMLLTRRAQERDVKHRDGFMIVTVGWLVVSFFGCLPYLFSGVLGSFTNAYFEAMAGFTTTGATVLTDIDGVSRGILLWRSESQWVGGMGIILFMLAVLPYLGAGGALLFKAEVPELTIDRLRPRIMDTAKSLWYIYASLTAAVLLLYWLGGMTWFDALNHSFTTMATGGFSTKNASLAHFDSAYIDAVATLFMFLAGINYTIYFNIFHGRIYRILRSDEFLFYIKITVAAIVFLTIKNWATEYGSILESLRYSSFQAVSIMTTTGYATADYEMWIPFSQALLIMLMFFGGMIGSTGGGMKQVRVLLMFRQGYRELYQMVHPHAVTTVRLEGKPIGKELLGSIWGFLFLFLFVIVFGTLGMTLLDVDIVTAATSVISAVSNVGPAFGTVGPTENFAHLPDLGKWILSACMLIGRLEVFTVIILFIPHFWIK